MRTYFAPALLTFASAVKVNTMADPLNRIPNVRDYLYEYPGVDGHFNQDYYAGRRKSVHSKKDIGENFDYYPVPKGIDYDDFYPGFSYFNPEE